MKSPSKKEKLLLKLLGATVGACTLIILLAVTVPEIRDLREGISLSEENIANIRSLRVNEDELETNYSHLREAINIEKDRYYPPGERDLTQLGIKMLAMIQRNGLRYSRLHKVESRDGSYVEIALTGHIVSVMNLLKDIYTNPKYLNVNFLTVTRQGGTANATIRINYGENAPLSP